MLSFLSEPELTLADPATPVYLLGLATGGSVPIDAEDFGALVSVALAYLVNERFQEALVAGGATPTLLKAFSDSYTRFDAAQLDAEDAAQLRVIRSSFVRVLADVSALPSFAALHPLHSPVAHTLQAWLRSGGGFSDLETAACLALGNLARSDEASLYLVQEAQLHLPLLALLAKPYPDAAAAAAAATPPAPLLHAALSFLKNLAIPAANKAALLEGPAPVLPRLWAAADAQPQAQFAAVSLARLLLVACPANVRRLCAPLSPDPASPAHDRSNLHVLAALVDRVDAEPTKVEAARAVAAVCRVLHSTPILPILPAEWGLDDESFVFKPPSSSSPSSSSVTALDRSPDSAASPAAAAAAVETDGVAAPRRARFYAAHLDMAGALTYLITQKRFPALRSEAFFVFALMSRAADGARVVVRALQPFDACRALVEAVSGRDMVDGTELRLAGQGLPDADEEFMAGLRRSGGDGAGTAAGGVAETAIDDLGLEPQQVDPAQAASMAKIDRENGLVLIAEILKNYADFLPPFRRSVFEELLRTGGELVLHERLKDQA